MTKPKHTPGAEPMQALETLRDAMIANSSRVTDSDGQWLSDLPTFGGTTPPSTNEVWSWDATRLLVGTCAEDLEIVSREDWA